MKNLILIAAGIALSLLYSCKEQEIIGLGTEPLEVATEGISLTSTSEFDLMGNISADGGTFMITAGEEGSKCAHILHLYLNGMPLLSGAQLQTSDMPDIDGPWGSVTYLTEKAPYEISVTIMPNNTGETRTLTFEIGQTQMKLRRITINQPGEKSGV